MTQRIGPILWIFCAQFFIAEQIASAGWRLPYSFSTNFISDLGKTTCDALVCSPWHALMNASFCAQGCLIAGGAIVASRLSRPVRILLVLCGLGTFLVGCFPSDINTRWHVAGAAMHFLSGGLGIIAAGFALHGGLKYLSLVVGGAILAATVLLGQSEGAVVKTFGVGWVERVAAYGIAGWMASMGLLQLVSPARWMQRG